MSDNGNELLDDPVAGDDSPSIKKSPAAPASKPKRVASRFFNALLALAFFVLLILSIVSFSSFSYVYQRTNGAQGVTSGSCILNADYHSDGNTIDLGTDGSCRLGIGGEVVIAVYAILSIVAMIIKIVGGWSMMSCFLIFELVSVTLMMLLSFCTSVVTSVGFSLTCRNFRSQHDGEGCSSSNVGGYHFQKGLQVAEATAWLGFAVLVGITVFYVFCVIMYCYGRRQAKKAKQ
uniref:MARVEL domain-containing protein n=1 Tax=Amphimedon queenslandica TaxID=400682 RepID=A0A1X7VEM1_AMPQE